MASATWMCSESIVFCLHGVAGGESWSFYALWPFRLPATIPALRHLNCRCPLTSLDVRTNREIGLERDSFLPVVLVLKKQNNFILEIQK